MTNPQLKTRLILMALLTLLTTFPRNVGAEEIERSAPGLDAIANANISGIYPQPISLVDGHWEGKPCISGGLRAHQSGR